MKYLFSYIVLFLTFQLSALICLLETLLFNFILQPINTLFAIYGNSFLFTKFNIKYTRNIRKWSQLQTAPANGKYAMQNPNGAKCIPKIIKNHLECKSLFHFLLIHYNTFEVGAGYSPCPDYFYDFFYYSSGIY